MKATAVLFISIFLISCSSSSSLYDNYPDRVTINPPEKVPYVNKELHIRSVEKFSDKRTHALIIEGDFPNACTQILEVEENTKGESFSLEIVGWQKYQEMCAQVISPFTFIYEVEKDQIQNLSSIIVNNTEFQLNSVNQSQND